jgi:carboxyl-terminal processing protease
MGRATAEPETYQIDEQLEQHHLGANKELISTIGIAADHHAPLTADDLSSGRDPGVATALRLLS